MINAVSYFTNGYCVGTGSLYSPSVFTNGLLYPDLQAKQPGSGVTFEQSIASRKRRARKAREEAEMVMLLVSFVEVIERERH